MDQTVELRTTVQDVELQLKSLYPTFTTAQDALDKILHAAEAVRDEIAQVLARKSRSWLTETKRLVDAAFEELGRLKTAGEEISEESPHEPGAAGVARMVTQEASARIAELLNQIVNRLLNGDFTGQILKLITSLASYNAHPVMKELAKAATATGVSMRVLDSLSGIEFEGLITRLLEHMGFRAGMTKASGDGGIDIVATLDQPLIGGRYLIQCKRYAPDSPVGAATVREFYGVLTADRRAVKGILVTTSGFTVQSQEFARGLPIELIGRDQLQLLLEQHGLLHPEIPGGHPVAQLVTAYGLIVEFILPCLPSTGAELRSSWDSIVGHLPYFLRPDPHAGVSALVSTRKS
jgi:HJR/Mrr/RecB family endonuclease